ncbi:hypothetical protein CGC21_38340 [Leishmania donovani]|uniref:Uncharacterized protein n=1 Tax=Leishmania donovani TaxID=5661 RepID=A0A504Y8F8_LEIDO|nr:hypothetical protein CGC21_38340 [Leishmania donovani]
MDAAALFHERQADVAAFTALVFRRPTSAERKPRPTSASVSSATHTATSEAEAVTSSPPMIRVAAVTPAYRRPASANVPVSRVLQEIKARAEREQRMARKTKKMARSDADDLAGGLPHLATSGSRSGAPLGAMGFSAQEIRDRTYLWMTELGSHCSSADDVSRRAAKKSAALTPQQQAQLRRLRIKRTRQRLFTGGRLGSAAAAGVVTQWLPSHSRLVKRFHYRIVFLAVQPGVTHVSLTTATSSIPSHHGGDAALSSTAPSATMLADLSHHCVYVLTPRKNLLAVLGLHPDVEGVGAAPSGVVFALSPTARHQRTRRTCATVVHGHMWCAGAACLENAALKAADQRRDSVSTLSRHTRVVPVVLVASLRARAAVASMEVLLFSEGPVHFTSRAMTQLRIQLVSSWNPCTLSSARASAFEYWRCDPCAPSSQSEPEALSTLQGALQRCARVYRRLHFSSPFLSDSHRNGSGEGRAAPYAWRLALLYRVPESRRRAACTRIRDAAARSAASLGVERAVATPSPRRRCLLSWQARRAHFQLARRFFGFLLMAPPRTETTLSGAAARGRCRALGFQDRVTLLHLLGRPAYPLDYGLRTPTDGTSAAAAPVCARLPSYLHILKYYGNVSNAACRVFVRAAHTDHKLPTLHCSVGTVLLQYRWLQRRGRGALCIPGVARIGVVTSSAFFAQRFGCMVAPVWCCFPPTTSGTGGGPILAALDNEEEHALPVAAHGVHWTAASLVGDTASASDALTYLLAPPEVADDLLRRSTLLQRDELPRKRAHSRHQRVFDLGQGRAMRELETLLYDPLSCSPVQLIQWYA